MKEVEGIKTNTTAGKAALAVRTKARGIMGDDFITFRLVEFVEFMKLNNKFADMGIFITDDNREDAYIKLIEKGDPSLIDDLERYINLKDSINVISEQKNEYDEIINRLKDNPTDDDVKDIVKDYLQR